MTEIHSHYVPDGTLPGERVRALCGRLLTLASADAPVMPYCPDCLAWLEREVVALRAADADFRARIAAADAARSARAEVERYDRRMTALAALRTLADR